MHDWVSELGAAHRVLDVGAGAGSMPGYTVSCRVVALDEDTHAFAFAPPPGENHLRVYGRGDAMPFDAASFDLVLCHHVLEHIPQPAATLAEIRRVLKPGGRFYAAVPNGYGLCDGVYRYVFAGGGHVNRFDRAGFARMVEDSLGLPLARWQKLYSSFRYLWGLDGLSPAPPGLAKRTARLARLPRGAIHFLQWLLYVSTRLLDRLLHRDLAVYGWALYFERTAAPPEEVPGYVNVCLRCGVGHPAKGIARMPRRRFQCSNCYHPNPYFPPSGNTL